MRAWLVLGLFLPIVAVAQTRALEGGSDEGARLGEVQPSLPEFPKPADYLPLQVSATTPFKFFVDAKSVSVGKDGVVRYSLIAKSAEGTLNVSFEGIRCSSRQFRVYAYGRPDNTWSEARISQWQQIPPDARNSQRAVLFGDYFCVTRGIIESAEDIVGALRRGPRVPSSL
jgi:hypothetical protein